MKRTRKWLLPFAALFGAGMAGGWQLHKHSAAKLEREGQFVGRWAQ